jgi:hypothetical protein
MVGCVEKETPHRSMDSAQKQRRRGTENLISLPSSCHHHHHHQRHVENDLDLPIPMILTVTPFEFAAEYDPDGVTDGDSLRTIARGPTATVEGGRRAVVVAVMLSVTLALVL